MPFMLYNDLHKTRNICGNFFLFFVIFFFFGCVQVFNFVTNERLVPPPPPFSEALTPAKTAKIFLLTELLILLLHFILFVNALPCGWLHGLTLLDWMSDMLTDCMLFLFTFCSGVKVLISSTTRSKKKKLNAGVVFFCFLLKYKIQLSFSPTLVHKYCL